MRILGPLVCSSTSPVTATFSRSLASVVTFAPSTTRATGSETLEPGSESSFSTLTTSPTATTATDRGHRRRFLVLVRVLVVRLVLVRVLVVAVLLIVGVLRVIVGVVRVIGVVFGIAVDDLDVVIDVVVLVVGVEVDFVL